MSGAFTVQLTGGDAPELASQVRVLLADSFGDGVVGEVERLRVDDVVALLSVVFGGVSAVAAVPVAAQQLYDWWQKKNQSGVSIVIERSDGTRLEFVGDVSVAAIEAVLGAEPAGEQT